MTSSNTVGGDGGSSGDEGNEDRWWWRNVDRVMLVEVNDSETRGEYKDTISS